MIHRVAAVSGSPIQWLKSYPGQKHLAVILITSRDRLRVASLPVLLGGQGEWNLKS